MGKVANITQGDLATSRSSAQPARESLHCRLMRRCSLQFAVVLSVALLVAIASCQRVGDAMRGLRASVTQGVSSAHAGGPLESAGLQRYLVLNVVGELSKLTLGSAAASNGTGETAGLVSGQIVVNPEDLAQLSGVLELQWSSAPTLPNENQGARGKRVQWRFMGAGTTGPRTLATLATPGALARLSVAGVLATAGNPGPANTTFAVTADITEGQLNGMRLTTETPLNVAEPGELRAANRADEGLLGANLLVVARPNPAGG